jgi:uncharacterized membrane protein
MSRTVVALFDNFGTAENAIQRLVEEGFERDSISLVANDYTGDYTRHSHEGPGMVGAAGAGAALGGVAGLLLSLGALAIPGIGPIVAAGPLAAALAGAGIGAAAGGLTGALVNMGIPEDEAEYYAEGVRRGGALVTVRCDDTQSDDAMTVLRRHGAVNIEERVAEWARTAPAHGTEAGPVH